MSRKRSIFRSLLIASLLGSSATAFAQQTYDPSRQVDPRLQQQLTPYQQEQLRQAQYSAAQRAAQAQQAAQMQRDPRMAQNPNMVQPAQYQPPAYQTPAVGTPGQVAPGQMSPGQLSPGQLSPGQIAPGQPSPVQGGMMPTPQLIPPCAPAAPFQLTPEQERDLDAKLKAWETASAAVKTFKATYVCWEYDPVWGPKDQNMHKTETRGEVKYAAPDKGSFIAKDMKVFNAGTQKYDAANDVTQLESWVCDGQYIYHPEHATKKYFKNELPPNMRGTQIADGPLPFVFGQKADKLKTRYWVRVVTPPNVKGQVWLEAFPKYQSDAANYKKVDLILDEATMNPLAIQTHDPSQNGQAGIRKVFQFAGHAVNPINWNPLFGGDFIQPAMPSGYKLVEEPYQEPSAAPQQPGVVGRPGGMPANGANPNGVNPNSIAPNGMSPSGVAPQPGTNQAVRPGMQPR